MRAQPTRGQALVEFALVLPIFVVVLAGIITLGIGIFYQQQLTNAAREAARYAAVHSATSQCPTTSRLDPAWNRIGDASFDKDTYFNCDPPDLGWPQMTAHARSKVFGLSAPDVHFSACWSGYWDENPVAQWDAPALEPDPTDPTTYTQNEFKPCTIDGTDPRTQTSALSCPAGTTVDGDDTASDLAATGALTSNQVTVYACYQWNPPFIAALLGAPIKLQAVVTEALQHQR